MGSLREFIRKDGGRRNFLSSLNFFSTLRRASVVTNRTRVDWSRSSFEFFGIGAEKKRENDGRIYPTPRGPCVSTYPGRIQRPGLLHYQNKACCGEHRHLQDTATSGELRCSNMQFFVRNLREEMGGWLNEKDNKGLFCMLFLPLFIWVLLFLSLFLSLPSLSHSLSTPSLLSVLYTIIPFLDRAGNPPLLSMWTSLNSLLVCSLWTN